MPPPFLGTALVGDGGERRRGRLLRRRGRPSPARAAGAGAGRRSRPSCRPPARCRPTRGSSPGHAAAGRRVPFWRADTVRQSYLPGTNVLRTVARFGDRTADASSAGSAGRPIRRAPTALARRVAPARAGRAAPGRGGCTGARCSCCGPSPTAAPARRSPAPATAGPTSGRVTRRRSRSPSPPPATGPRRAAWSPSSSGLDLDAAARFDVTGAPVAGRAAQGDAAGWVAAAARAVGHAPRPAAPASAWRGPRRLSGESARRLPRQRDRRRRPARGPFGFEGRQGLTRVAGLRLRPRLGGGLGGAAVPAPAPLPGRPPHPAAARRRERALRASSPPRTGRTPIPGPRRPPGAPGASPPSASAAAALRLMARPAAGGDAARPPARARRRPLRHPALDDPARLVARLRDPRPARQLWPDALAAISSDDGGRPATLEDCAAIARGMKVVVDEGRWLATEPSVDDRRTSSSGSAFSVECDEHHSVRPDRGRRGGRRARPQPDPRARGARRSGCGCCRSGAGAAAAGCSPRRRSRPAPPTSTRSSSRSSPTTRRRSASTARSASSRRGCGATTTAARTARCARPWSWRGCSDRA